MAKEVRDKSIDGLKLLLIGLVTFGHLVGYKTGSRSTELISASVIYTFHMPLFVLLSGFFSKGITPQKLKRGTPLLLETFLCLSIVFVILSEGKLQHLWGPTQSNWYLLSLVLWRWIYFLLEQYLPQKVYHILVACVGAFLVLNFLPTNTGLLSLQRTFQFFPYFIIGTSLAGIPKFKGDKLLAIAILTAVVALTACYVEYKWMLLHYHLFYIDFYMLIFKQSWINTNLIWLLQSTVALLMSLAIWKLFDAFFTFKVCRQTLLHIAQYGQHSITIFILQGIVAMVIPKIFSPSLFESILLTLATVSVGIYLGEKGYSKWLSTPISSCLHLMRQRRGLKT